MDNFIEITSKDNPLIKLVGCLQASSKARKENGFFVLEGLRICKDAYENSIRFDKLIVTKNALEKYAEDIEKFQKVSDKTYLLTENLFRKISDTDNPQGIIALAKFPEIETEISKMGRYIALENIADPANLGAVSRTAEALGVSGIILSSNGCDPYSPKSLRSSMGTLLRMPLYIVDDVSEFISLSGLRSFACVVDKAAKSINKIDFTDGDVVLIGNEANGLTDAAKASAYESITIPMNGKAESLNAAAAAAISMWEMMKE